MKYWKIETDGVLELFKEEEGAMIPEPIAKWEEDKGGWVKPSQESYASPHRYRAIWSEVDETEALLILFEAAGRD